jgi:hypothetical protein
LGRERRLLVVLAIAGLVALPALVARAADHPNQTLPYGEVNWSRGYVRISAMGLPPIAGGGGDAARQNAVSMAQKRLLATVLDMKGQKGRLRDLVARRPELKERLRTLVTTADVKGKAFADGSVEVTLTVPTEGPGGLRALLRDY